MVRMTDFVALRNGGRSSPPDSFRASRSRPSFLSSLGSDNKVTQKRQEAVRDRFFKNDPTISDDRLNRRYSQFAGEEKFKQNLKDQGRVVEGLKQIDPVTGKPTDVFMGATPVFDTNTASPTFGKYVSKTLADRRMELANKFGPKPSEIMSDIGKGLGSIAQGFAEKGPPIMQLFSGLKDKFTGMMPQAGTPSFFNPNDIIGLVNALPQAQKAQYYSLLSSGTPYQQAYEMASGMPIGKFMQMSNGGIATLQ